MRKIWIVDAFTEMPYSGNPTAIMFVEDFSDDMPQIAAEMNLSETAFVKQLPGTDHFHIRWYSPSKVEVQLCGHATLAAAYVLFSKNYVQSNIITFDSLSGYLTVKKELQGNGSF